MPNFKVTLKKGAVVGVNGLTVKLEAAVPVSFEARDEAAAGELATLAKLDTITSGKIVEVKAKVKAEAAPKPKKKAASRAKKK